MDAQAELGCMFDHRLCVAVVGTTLESGTRKDFERLLEANKEIVITCVLVKYVMMMMMMMQSHSL